MEGHSQREKVTDPETTPKKLKCVCEMCTCGSNIKNVGKHHCPRPRIKGTYTTSYSSHYQNMPQLQKPPPQPEYQYQQRHYNPEDMRTSYQNTFTGEKVQSIPPPSTLEHNRIVAHVPFTGGSSYKEQFKPFVVSGHTNPEQFQPIQAKVQNSPSPYRSPVKFEGVSAYKSQFVQPPKVQSDPIPEQVYRKVNVPFYGSSSYKNDFPEFRFDVRPKEQYSAEYRRPVVKFEGSSSYKEQFKGYHSMMPESTQGEHACAVEGMAVPTVNYINNQNHIYYDPDSRKFI